MVVVARAPAKLTLSLRVTGVRPDGYHLLDSEMVTLAELYDCVELGPGDGFELVGGADMAIAAADNLVTRALALVGRSAAVRLTKRIPVGAGLGGGSSDAAAVLRWAGVVPSGNPGDPALRLAARLGADVPFCLVGGRARVSGIGEVVESLPPRPLWVALVTPPFGVSTPAVYAAWDRLGGPSAQGPNDLESPALEVEPRLCAWRDALGESTGRTPVLAGSGSSWFVMLGSQKEADDLAGLTIEVAGTRLKVNLLSAEMERLSP